MLWVVGEGGFENPGVDKEVGAQSNEQSTHAWFLIWERVCSALTT